MGTTDLNLDNIDTTNPEALAEIFAQMERGEEPAAKTADPAPAAQDDKQTQVATDDKAKADAGKQTDQEQNDPEGVATKDGKHIIPYSVLQSERDRANRASQALKEMQDRVAQLEQMVQGNQGAKQGEGARTTPQASQVEQLSDEDLEALKEDFPTVYKAVQAAMKRAEMLESKLAPVEEMQAERVQSVQESVQDAIDSVPKLAHIQATDADAFELAKQFDATLREQTAWANRPLNERFQKVTEMVEAALGPIQLPASSKQASQPSAQELRQAAEAKAKEAAKKNSAAGVPTSLSDFKGGVPAATDEAAAAEQMSQQQLAELFSKMSPEQMDEYLANL